MPVRTWVPLFLGLAATSSAWADDQPTYDYLNLSFTGDGSTPSAMDTFEKQARVLTPPRSGVSVGDSGAASYAVPIQIPPALLAPDLRLLYQDGGGSHGWLARGWAVNAGLQITRVTGAAASHAYADYEAAYKISGAGLDGVLLPFAGGWKYLSVGPIAVKAELGADGAWTVTAGGVTTRLAPTVAYDVDQPPVEWRGVSSRDASGNTISYTWVGSRLDRITYGGATEASGAVISGEQSLVQVNFEYGARATTSYRAVQGHLELIDERLDRIVVQSRYGGASFEDVAIVSLAYDDLDEETYLVGIYADAVDSAETLPLATFEYAAIPDLEDALTIPDLNVPDLSYGTTAAREAGHPSWSATQEGVFDVSGDGLVEGLDASWWGATWYLWDPAFELPDEKVATWDAPRIVDPAADTPCGYDDGSGCDDDGASIDRSYTVRCADDWSKTISSRILVDVDGDGFQDVVQMDATAEVPDAYYPGAYLAPSPFCDDQTTAVLSDTASYPLIVWFGDADGFAAASMLADLPVHFPRLSIGPVTKDQPAITLPATLDVETTMVDMLDVDGDGWADIVQVVVDDLTGLTELQVYYHEGWRDGGWSDVPVPMASGTPGLSIGSLSSTEQDLAAAQYRPPGASWVSTPVQVEFVHVVRALRDINGDGFPDFVNATDWSVLDPTWQVWFGTGRRDGQAFAAAVSWPSPIRDLALTDEGSPAVLACTVSEPDFGEGSPLNDYLFGIPLLEEASASGGGGLAPLTAMLPDLSCAFTGGIPGNMDWGSHGIPQRQLVGLVDMDGDGRADLVDLMDDDPAYPTGRWWRNLGDGFSSVTRDAPSWFNGALNASVTRQTVFMDEELLAGEPLVPGEESPLRPSNGVHFQLWSVFDVDQDGLPDRYDANDLHQEYDDAGVTYMPRALGRLGGARPGAMTSATSTYGARTNLSYQSSARLSPSGEDQTHAMRSHHDVIDTVEVIDPVSGNAARQEYAWTGGVLQEGQFLGFEQRAVKMSAHDADVHMQLTYQDLAFTTTSFLLDRDHALPSVTDIYLDAIYTSVVGSPTLLAIWRRDQRIARNYETRTFDDGAGTVLSTDWLATQIVTDYPENGFDDDRSSTVEYDRDAYGNATAMTYLVADCAAPPTSLGPVPGSSGGYLCTVAHEDDRRVDIEYAHDADHSFYVPSMITTSGWDAGTGAWASVEHGDFFYDGGVLGAPITAGKLSRQEVWVDPASPAEVLTWSFTRDARGALTQLEGPAGQLELFTPTFGHALHAQEENGEGHSVSHTFDAFGRETETIDANGLATRSEYDDFGRAVEAYVTPVGGDEYRTAFIEHLDTPGAAYVRTVRSTYDASTGAPINRTEYQVLDGYGDAIQAWKPAEAIGEWIVAETIKDTQGNVVRESYPHREAAFSPDFEITRDPRFTTWNELDGYGRPHRTWSDYDAGLGETITSYPGPGWAIVTDAVGYQTIHHTDTHGALVAVYQSLGSLRRQTATWVYDARARVTGFVDANGNAYDYGYDGAGRLREVARTPFGSATEDWYAYEYEGRNPVEMWEGGYGGTLVATWTYDTLGRTLSKDVLDRSTGLFDAYTWSWDAQWKGARDTVTDPSGDTDYTYTSGDFGGLGHPTSVTRTWDVGGAATFNTSYDFEGHPVEVTWPSGATVASTYGATGWLAAQDVDWGTQTAHVASAYDAFGMPSGWTGGELGAPGVFTSAITRTTPGRIDGNAWALPDGTARALTFTWADNGLLTQKLVDRTGTPTTILAYGYDDFLRVATVTNTGTLEESYTYDPLGNLTEMTRRPRVYMYNTHGPVRFSEVRDRMSDLGETTNHTWDTQGRMATWDVAGGTADVQNTYAYDGAGRLVRIDRAAMGVPTTTTTYGYDVDDQLVLETKDGDAIFRFDGYRYDEATGKTIEKLLPMVGIEDGALRWTQIEPDGHALATYTSLGAEVSSSLLGAYGLAIAESGTWEVDGFHGMEPDRSNDVTHMGARHMLVRDGTWMQPEPLLYLGPTNGELGAPLRYGGVYAGGDPIGMQDVSGRFTDEQSEFKQEYFAKRAAAWAAAHPNAEAARSNWEGSIVGGNDMEIRVQSIARGGNLPLYLPERGPTSTATRTTAAGDVASATVKASASEAGVARNLHVEAEGARDALAGSLAAEKHPPATVVGAYSPSSGQVTAGASRGGGLGCAEGVCSEALGNPSDIQFTTAVRPRTGGTVPVCANCEATYGRGAFPDPATPFKTDETP